MRVRERVEGRERQNVMLREEEREKFVFMKGEWDKFTVLES